jgi:hypothetical protein
LLGRAPDPDRAAGLSSAQLAGALRRGCQIACVNGSLE